jgi:hypothetical protein
LFEFLFIDHNSTIKFDDFCLFSLGHCLEETYGHIAGIADLYALLILSVLLDIMVKGFEISKDLQDELRYCEIRG